MAKGVKSVVVVACIQMKLSNAGMALRVVGIDQ